LTVTGIEEEQGLEPTPGLRLGQNPVRGRARLSYELTRDSRVTCMVSDAAGRYVAELFNGSQAAGSHSLEWDASAVNPGVYFAELKSGPDTRVVRMVKVH
jgi:hypothetical protein